MAPVVNYFFLSDPTRSIEKSSNDKKTYQIITLDNDLEVILIHDPDATQGAAALDVKTGQLQDPKDRQGLAHYLEHMLFLGTKKYPESGAYSTYLSQHGGSSNAFTALEDTNYHFAINAAHLQGALDRFAQFFIAPKLDPKFALREINAVESEHQKNMTNDFRRRHQVQKSLYRAGLPISQFGTGSLKSLGGKELNAKQLQADLAKFYQQQYSSNRMKLAVSGPQSLEELAGWVTESFGPIKNKKLVHSPPSSEAVITAKMPRLVQVQSIKEKRLLQLSWVIPTQKPLWQQRPSLVVGQLLGDEGEGSLLSYLKQQGWATQVNASSSFGTSRFGLFELFITLTPDGMNHWKEINESVFTYIKKAKADQGLQRFQDELNLLGQLEFKFLPEQNPANRVQTISLQMQRVPAEKVLIYPYEFTVFSGGHLESILDKLTPENLTTYLSHQGVSGDQVEPWYGTQYSVGPVDEATVATWKNPAQIPALKLPPPNPFIPKKVEVIKGIKTVPSPTLLVDQPGLRAWVQPDGRFNSPKVKIKALLSSPVAYDSPEHAALTKLYTQVVSERLNEWVYPARLAGSAFNISSGVRGIELGVEGYPETLPLLLDKLVAGLLPQTIDPNKFTIEKRKLKEDRYNQQFGKAYHRAMYEFYYLNTAQMWHNRDYLHALQGLETQGLEAFVPELLKKLHVELLLTGNLDTKTAKKLATGLSKQLGAEPLLGDEIIETRSVKLPQGSSQVHQIQIEDNNSATHLYYQAGPVDLKQSAQLTLLSQMIEKPMYHQLRTIEQLGYVVWSIRARQNNLDGMSFLVQSSVKSPPDLKTRIEAFLAQYETQLKNTTTEEFQQYKDAAVQVLLKPTKNINEETARSWRPIVNRELNFDERAQQATQMKTVKLADLTELYRKLFLDHPKVLATLAFAKGLPLLPATPDKINDVSIYKSSSTYAPNPATNPRIQANHD